MRSRRTMVIGAVAVLLIGGLIGGGYVLMQESQRKRVKLEADALR